MEQCWAGEPSRRPLLGAILPVLESIRSKALRGQKALLNLDSDSESRSASPLEEPLEQQQQQHGPVPNGKPVQLMQNNVNHHNNNNVNDKYNNHHNNKALALLEPNNQRGEVASPLFVPNRRKKKQQLHNAILRTPKHPGFHMTNFFQTSACSNLYIQMHEF